MMPRVIHLDSFATEAARFILDAMQTAVSARGFCRLALSGGETPREVNRELVRLAGDLPWERVQITFGDERCVPPDHEDSNYRMAHESLLEPAGIPAGNVFRMRGEIDPEAAATEYESRLAAVAARVGEERYVHDLILLGLGPDGHTASLFPGLPALDETERNILPVIGPKPPPQRLTMTFPLLNAARQICFLARGAAKLPIVEEIVSGRSVLPAARVQPPNGSVTWLTGS
ncbi:MAG TPA: 6-phosphogluconolactonase [Chthoniobacteraceae bacterium]|jgi:6-phosphogluconolactonase|nr:6-phosphogluconolactonase [Chthoniobacteraceae bacterium]